jgi:hypothetical protein
MRYNGIKQHFINERSPVTRDERHIWMQPSPNPVPLAMLPSAIPPQTIA